MDTTTTPHAVSRYLDAADRGDDAALAECFTPSGTVTDEGHTYRGQAEIARWRGSVARQWTYTATVTGTERVDASRYRVSVRLVGNFPGGVADVVYRFDLDGDSIRALVIGG